MGQREKSADWIYLCLKDYTSGGESTIWLINHESIFIWGRKSKNVVFWISNIEVSISLNTIKVLVERNSCSGRAW